MNTVRLARCDNDIELPDGGYERCSGILAFGPLDSDAPCGRCGARCGSLVASYLIGGPWPQAIARWFRDVADAWREDHEAGHPRGSGRCPTCAVSATLDRLDGSTAAAVSVLTGMTRERLDELGGFED